MTKRPVGTVWRWYNGSDWLQWKVVSPDTIEFMGRSDSDRYWEIGEVMRPDSTFEANGWIQMFDFKEYVNMVL